MKININTLKNLSMSPIVPTFEDVTKNKNIIIVFMDGTVCNIENKYEISEEYLEYYDSIFELMKDIASGITKENYKEEFNMCFHKDMILTNYVKSRMQIVNTIYLTDM